MTNLFFDDYRILSRENVIREQGCPTLIPDSVMRSSENESFAYADPSVTFDSGTGIYTMYMHPYRQYNGGFVSFSVAYTSRDLIHWEPRNTAREGHVQGYDYELVYENQYFNRFFNGETITVIRDDMDTASRRYKAIANKNDYYGGVDCLLLTSPDGVHWEEQKGVYCHSRGTEGIGSAFWSDVENCWILALRPFVGERRVSILKTTDFKEFTKPSLAIWADALDDPLSETYGLKAFSYKGWYIGLLHIYHALNQNTWKYVGGTMDFQLAYSTNGVHWQRYLRKALIDNTPGLSNGMVFGSSPVIGQDGDIYIITACSEHEHGNHEMGIGAIATYKLREDGFACLTAEAGKVGRVFTRTILHRSGDIDFNIKARKATWAFFNHEAKPIDGFTHEDCIPFSGDEKHYVPQFKNGKSIRDLVGSVFSIEVKFEDGSLNSYSGDYINMSQMEVKQYLIFGRVPDVKGQN